RAWPRHRLHHHRSVLPFRHRPLLRVALLKASVWAGRWSTSKTTRALGVAQSKARPQWPGFGHLECRKRLPAVEAAALRLDPDPRPNVRVRVVPNDGRAKPDGARIIQAAIGVVERCGRGRGRRRRMMTRFGESR